MLNIRHFQNGLQIVPRPDGNTAPDTMGDLAVYSVDGGLYYNNGTTTSEILTTDSGGGVVVFNKELDDTTVFFVHTSDNTIQLHFNVLGATGTTTTLQTSQTANRLIVFPDASGTVVLTGGSSPGVITNNLLDEASVWFVDHTDNSKAFKFNSTGNTTATSMTLLSATTVNQVLTLPNTTDTLVARNTTDTLTNKTLTAPIINNATADTITGITGGALTVQSASNEDLILKAEGTGNIDLVIVPGQVINVDNVQIYANSIRGANTGDLLIEAQGGSNNLQLAVTGSGLVEVLNPARFEENQSWDRDNDNSTTGTDAVLAGFVVGYVKLINSGLVSISGIPAGRDGQLLVLSNLSGNSVTVNNEDTGILAANRIQTGTNSSINLNNTTSIELIYDGDSQRWRVAGSVGGPPMVFGTRGSPELITAAVGINATATNMSATSIDQVIFVEGNGGPVNITATPQIQAGSIVGQRMQLVGRDNTNTVQINNVSGSVELNGNCILGLSDVLSLLFDGTAWVETSRS